MANTGFRINTRWYGRGVLASINAAQSMALSEALEHLLQETNKVAPLDEGHLIRSGDISKQVTNTKVIGHVFYDVPYAVRMHEHPEYSFQNGRKGKYLSKTLTRLRPTLLEFFKSRIEASLRR